MAAGEVAAAMGGDGLISAVAGELRHTDGVLAVLPGGRGNDFARKLGLGSDPVAACDVLAAGREQRIDVADIDGRAYLGIASSGLDSDAGDLANATRLKLGQLVYVYATLRAVRAWRPARWEVVIDGAPRSFTGYSVAVANSGVFGGGMYLAPEAKLDDGLLDVVMIHDLPKRTYLAALPKVFTGAHVREPGRRDVPGARGRLPRRPPVQRPGRRRPDRRPPRHRAGPARCAERHRPVSLLAPKLAAAKAVGALARRAGRGGGTSLPGKLLTRLEPHAIGLLAGRLEHGSVVISATNGKTTTAAMVASILERTGSRLVHNRAGANMAGGVASALAAASRRGGRELDGDLGLFEVDEFWLGPVVEELQPRALLLANLFRDQLDRYGELDTIADRWAVVVERRPAGTQLVLNADDPLVADLGRKTEALYFGVEDDSVAHTELQHASDSKHCRNCGHAYVYDAAYMGHLGRLPLPALRQPPPRPGGGGASRCSCAGSARPPSRCARRRARRASSCRCPGSTTSTTRSAPPRCASRSASSCRRSRPASAPSSPPSAAPRRSTSTAARPRSCWSRTRRARTRSCARSRSRAASSTCSASSTTASPTAATSRGCGTPTGRRSRRTSRA